MMPDSNMLLSRDSGLYVFSQLAHLRHNLSKKSKLIQKNKTTKLWFAREGLENPHASLFLPKWSTGVLKIRYECLDKYANVLANAAFV